jgi:pSer/pThr/pTyr-binding forkhead associated (FHA) protein
VEKKPEPDLTTTIHLGTRQGPAALPTEQLVENLAQLNEEERNVVARLGPSDGMLIVHRGPGKGSRFLLANSSMIGRSPESEIFLDDVTVSRKHAIVAFTENRAFALKDLGSLNGTYVNGQPMVDVSLSSGDEIQIGKFHMLFFGGK